MAILLNLFEVYMKWFQMEKSNNPLAVTNSQLSITVQYLSVLSVCLVEFLLTHLAIRFISGVMLGRSISFREGNHVSMAMILSSFGKMLLIVMYKTFPK